MTNALPLPQCADYRVPNNKTIEEVLDAFEELIKDID